MSLSSGDGMPTRARASRARSRAALREMRRVCRPGGVVAARDADYAAMTWFPADPRLDRWMAVYSGVTRSNAAEPDAGRRLRSWALAAGFAQVSSSASNDSQRVPAFSVRQRRTSPRPADEPAKWSRR